MNIDQAVRLAVMNLSRHGLSDISTEALEKKLIESYQEEFIADIKAMLRRGSVLDMEFKPIQHMLTPKNRYVFDYRRAALIQPACLAKYTTLVLMAADVIEMHRVPVKDQMVFSTRFKPTEHEIFDSNINYSTWREKTKELAGQDCCSYIVQCDIAAFYDRINIHRIESTLESIGVKKDLVNKINDLLLFWSRKDSYGLPVGNVASRILAEAALIDIDQYLIGEGVKFTRYVDDYRLFAPDMITAQRWMNKLNTRLFRDGLMLNTGKTRLYLARKGDEEVTPKEEAVETKAPEAEVVLKTITRLTGGYNRIARTFIMPSSDKYKAFEKPVNASDVDALEQQDIVEFTSIQRLVISCLVQKRFELLVKLAETCTKYMYALDYFVDMLLKNKAVIPKKERDVIADFYSTQVSTHEYYAFEWHEATIARLLSDEGYFRKKALLHIFRSPNKEMVTYPAMIALEGLHGHLSRSEFRTIREWFDRCDDWEKRRIIHISSALPNDERKAWAKAIKPSLGDDLLGRYYADKIIRGKDI